MNVSLTRISGVLWASAVTIMTLLHPPGAQGAVDGVVSPGEYAFTLAVQNTPTGFGNNLSELDAAYASYTGGGTLRLALTGNLETNGNGLIVFLDIRSGGAVASTLGSGYGLLGSFAGQRVDDWGNDTHPHGLVVPTPGGSSIMSPGFNPDFALEINAGGGSGNYFISIIDLTLPNDLFLNNNIFLGQNAINGPAVTQTYFRDSGSTDAGAVTHAFNNTNTAGVGGYPGPLGDPLSAAKGFEFVFSPEFLAVPPGHQVKLLAVITNQNGSYLSNQFLPGLGGVANPGGAGGLGGTPLFDAQLFRPSMFLAVPQQGRATHLLATGDAVPAIGPGVTVAALGDPSTHFTLTGGGWAGIVTLAGPGISAANDQAVLRMEDISIGVVVREGDNAPGGGTFTSFDLLGGQEDPEGGQEGREIVIYAWTSDGQALYYQSSPTASLVKLLKTGDPLPDGGTVGFVWKPDGELDDVPGLQGRFVVWGQPSASTGMNFVGRLDTSAPGTLTKIARAQDSFAGGGVFESFDSVSVNASGLVAFRATLSGTAQTEGIFVGDGMTLSRRVASGDAAPDSDGFFDIDIIVTHITDTGHIDFIAALTGTANDEGVFRSVPGGAVLQIARKNQTVPGGNGSFQSFRETAFGKYEDGAVFYADIAGAGPGDWGIYAGDGINPLTELVRKGDFSPDVNGQVNEFLWDIWPEDDFSASHVLYGASLVNTLGGASDDTALIMTDGTESLVVGREGDILDGSALLDLPPADSTPDGRIVYQAALADGRVGYYLFAPLLLPTTGGTLDWDDVAWTLGLAPSPYSDILLQVSGSTPLIVTGPATDATLGSLTVGGGTAPVTFLRASSTGTSLDLVGDLVVHANGTLTATDSSQVLNVGGNATLEGALTLDDGATMTIAGDAVLFGEAVVSDGAHIALDEWLTIYGGLSINGGTVDAADYLLGPGATTTLTNGQLHLSGTATVLGDLDVQTGGIVDAADYVLVEPTGTIDLSGGGKLIVGSTNPAVPDGQVRVIDGEIASIQGTVIADSFVNDGLLSGTGEIQAALMNSGEMSPGTSPGTLTVTGDLTLGAAGTLRIELGGLTAGTQHDRVNVSGAATLGGTLELSLINGFVPQPGQQFVILTAGSVQGTFASVVGPSHVFVQYDPTNVTLMPCVSVPADLDGDCKVDGADFQIWKACGTGPAVPYDPLDLPESCALEPDVSGHIAADFDTDGDVDLQDFARWQRCYSGSMAAVPACAD